METKMKRKCVSWFWKFGNLALETIGKSFGNIVKGVRTSLVIASAQENSS